MPFLLAIIVLAVIYSHRDAIESAMTANQVLRPERAFDCTMSLVSAIARYSEQGPLQIKITSGARTESEQADLYGQGRIGDNIVNKNEIVTYAKHAWETPHGVRSNGAQAFDFVVLIDGVVVIPTRDDSTWVPAYTEVGAWFEREGFVWGGRWKDRFPPNGDIFHIETKDWRSVPISENVS